MDYKDLFKNLVNEKGNWSTPVYSSNWTTALKASNLKFSMQDRLKKARNVKDALETLHLLCEPVTTKR
ncbi:MAG: hypothetical protein R2741_03550 [Methanolobus sp.]